jgi:diacylglycerol kinase (ATP)
MRAAAILGLGCSPKDLKPFQQNSDLEWRIGMPSSGEADVILLFGGDGTIHRHLTQLVGLGLPVLIVPAGSGNDFANSLGLGRIRASLSAWRQFLADASNVRAIDLGVISQLGHESTRNSLVATRYYCCVAGVGIDAAVAERANRMPRWLRGNGGYALSLLPAMFTFAAFPLKIHVPCDVSGTNEQWKTRSDKPTLIAAFANTPLYGGGMKIAPQAKMDDGLLDVCVIGGIDPFKLFYMFPTVYAGRHLSIKEVEYFQAERLRVETEYPMDVYADGEFVCRTPIEVAVQRAAMRVIVPD